MLDSTGAKIEQEKEELFRTIALKEKTIVYTDSEHGFEETVKIKLPTLKQKETSNLMYSKTYNRLLQDGDFLTSKELLERARRRGVWSDEDETKLVSLDQDILDLKEQVNTESNKKKKGKLEEDLATARNEKFGLALRLGQITNTSVENIAESARNEYMLVNCVYSVDDSGEEHKLFNTTEELNNETDLTKIERILLDAKSFWSGEGMSDFLHFDD